MKETLKKLRLQNRYSQDLLAKILGVSRVSYMKYESGEVEPPVAIVRKLTKIYGISYKTLIDNELKERNDSVSFGDDDKTEIEVASPSPSYGVSVNSSVVETPNDLISRFTVMLAEMQNTIVAMQQQLKDLGCLSNGVNDFKKSSNLNKDDFFSKAGNVSIDSSYIDELRRESLI